MLMNRCQPELLVEYADEELSPQQIRIVEEHLAVCAECRRTLAALRKSIGLARIGWEENEESLKAFRPRFSSVVRRPRWMATGAIAAAVMLIVVGTWIWLGLLRHSKHEVRLASGGEDRTLNLAETREMIEQEGWAARLLFSANLLSEAPGGETLARERLEQIITDFPDTTAAQTARSRLGMERKTG